MFQQIEHEGIYLGIGKFDPKQMLQIQKALQIIEFFYLYYNLMLLHQRNQLIDTIIKNIQEPNSENTHAQQQADRSKGHIVLKKANNRFFKDYQNLVLGTPFSSRLSSSHHVYKLFNTFGINLTALTTPDFEESFVRTYFYHRVVTKVERYQNAIVINIIPLSQTVSQPNVNYLIQKLKSYGNVDLQRLANVIEYIWSSLIQLKNQNMQAIIQQDKQSITKYLNLLGREMFFCKFGLYKFALSNSLLEYLGYNVEEFCVETIKYRTVLFDFLSSNVYHQILSHALSTLKVLMDVDLTRATINEYLASSRLILTDYIYSKDHKKTYCDMEYTVPVRGIICFRIIKIHYQSNQLSWKPYCTSYQYIHQNKKKINEKQYVLLNKLGIIPSNWLSVSKSKVASYREKEDSSQSNSEQQKRM